MIDENDESTIDMFQGEKSFREWCDGLEDEEDEESLYERTVKQDERP